MVETYPKKLDVDVKEWDEENSIKISSEEINNGEVNLYESNDDEYPFVVEYSAVEQHYEEKPDRIAWKCENMKKARLVMGVFINNRNETWHHLPNNFSHPRMGIPTSIALAGNDVIASYLKMFYDADDYMEFNSRQYISNEIDVSKQVVSNYWNRIRWNKNIN